MVKKLNSEEIMKALECCDIRACDICPYDVFSDPLATCNVKEDALALINSQEQRIKELAEENESLKQCMEHEHASFMEIFGQYGEKCDKLAEDNERLRKNNAVLIEDNHILSSECIPMAKADTVRKMQERLDKRFCHDPAFLGVEQRLIMDVIDQIAKEMLEGENER